MSLKPQPIGPVPELTAFVARAAFPEGNTYTRLRDELGALYEDRDFAGLFPDRGQPALAPWRLAMVTLMQFLEDLSDRQAADAVRSRIDWKYALGLELTDPGFDFSALSEFRSRLIAGGSEKLLLDKMLQRLRARGLVKARGRQRTDSTHVLAAIRVLNRLELVAETLRATLNQLATLAPEWTRGVARPEWFERYGRRVEDSRLPREQADREAYARAVGEDGFALLDALEADRGRRPAPRHRRRAGPAHRLGAALRAGRGSGALEGRRRAAEGRRGARVALRPGGPLPDQARHALDRLHGPPDRDLRRGRGAPDLARRDDQRLGPRGATAPRRSTGRWRRRDCRRASTWSTPPTWRPSCWWAAGRSTASG